MDEYVTKEKVLAQLERCARDPYHETHYIRDAVINTIRRMEAADVAEVVRCIDAEPVKHGRWEEKDIIEDRKGMGIISDWQSARCSVCGKYHTTPYAYYFTNYEYCPSCGARMDGESDDE